MINLHEFLKIMDLDCELVVFDNNTFDKLIEGQRDNVDVPHILYDAEVVYFVPGILTRIFVNVED
jgi:hypothetical protein